MNRSSFTLWFRAVWKRRCSCCASGKERQQVPTGLHSQTVMTGWSNYWAVDTPAWREFISSRKGDSQITVYPHPAPSSGLILLMRSHTQTPWHCWHSRARNHPHAFKALLQHSHRPQPVSVFLFYMWAYVLPHAMNEPSLPVKHTFSRHQSAQNDNITQVCVREAEKRRIGETDDTRLVFNSHPLFE